MINRQLDAAERAVSSVCRRGLQMYGLIWLTDLRSKLSRIDLLIMLTSALCHDLDHPGYNNVYQVSSQPF